MKTNTYHKMMRAMQIFELYLGEADSETGDIVTGTDVIYAGGNWRKMHQSDIEELEDLGWYKDTDHGSGFYYLA